MISPWGVERGAFWALDLPASGPAPAARIEARFAPAGPAAAAALAAAMDVPAGEVASRLARGCRPVVAWHGEEIASYCWVSTVTEHVGELGRDLLLAPGDAYIWDCATLPRFRGHGLYVSLLRAVVDDLAAGGLRRAWIGATSTNLASNRTFASVGFRAVAAVISLRLSGRGVILRLRPAPGADPAVAAAAGRMLGRR